MSEALEIWVAQRTEKAKETAWLRRMYEEGLASGDAGPLDEDAIMAELNAEFAARKVA